MVRDAATTCDAPRGLRNFTRRDDASAILTTEDEARLAEAMAAMEDPLTGLLEDYGRIVRLQARLETLAGRLEQAHAYIGKPGSNPWLGRAQRHRLRAQCSGVIAELRDAERAARRRLGPAAP